MKKDAEKSRPAKVCPVAFKLELMQSTATFNINFLPGFVMVLKSNETCKIKWEMPKEPDYLHMTLFVCDRFDCIENVHLIHSEHCRFEPNELLIVLLFDFIENVLFV